MPAPIPADRPIRWGILGAGGIASKVASDIVREDGNVLGAVGARSALIATIRSRVSSWAFHTVPEVPEPNIPSSV